MFRFRNHYSSRNPSLLNGFGSHSEGKVTFKSVHALASSGPGSYAVAVALCGPA
jgi:hypothetical protein